MAGNGLKQTVATTAQSLIKRASLCWPQEQKMESLSSGKSESKRKECKKSLLWEVSDSTDYAGWLVSGRSQLSWAGLKKGQSRSLTLCSTTLSSRLSMCIASKSQVWWHLLAGATWFQLPKTGSYSSTKCPWPTGRALSTVSYTINSTTTKSTL